MKSKTGKLKEFCKIVAGATPSRAVQKYWDGDIPWITPKDIARLEDKVFINAPEKITKEGFESCSSTMLPKGTVLFSSRAPIGHVAIAGVELCTNQGFKSVVPGPEVDSLYLYYLLKSKVPEIQAKGRGATFAEINKEAMEELKVVFPPLPDQHRIAKMLDRVDALRQKQAEVQRMAGSLVPAVFEEMFGKTEERSAIGDCIQLIDYGTNQKAEHDSGQVPVLRMNNVTESGELDLTDIKKANFSPKELASNLLKPGDLLVNRTNSRELVGKVGIWMESYEAVAASYFIRVRVDRKRLLPKYAHVALNRPEAKQYFRSKANGAVGQANIGMETIKALKIPLPNIAQQELFVKRLEAVRLLAGKIQDRTCELNRLAESMATEIFRT